VTTTAYLSEFKTGSGAVLVCPKDVRCVHGKILTPEISSLLDEKRQSNLPLTNLRPGMSPAMGNGLNNPGATPCNCFRLLPFEPIVDEGRCVRCSTIGRNEIPHRFNVLFSSCVSAFSCETLTAARHTQSSKAPRPCPCLLVQASVKKAVVYIRCTASGVLNTQFNPKPGAVSVDSDHKVATTFMTAAFRPHTVFPALEARLLITCVGT